MGMEMGGRFTFSIQEQLELRAYWFLLLSTFISSFSSVLVSRYLSRARMMHLIRSFDFISWGGQREAVLTTRGR
jgi:hypothetical protein